MNFFIIHPIGYNARPRGHEPDRFQDIEDCLKKRGHNVSPNFDVLLVDLNVWNLAEGGTSPYDKAVMDGAMARRTPIVWFEPFDHWGTERYAATWPGANNWAECKSHPKDDFYTRIYQSSQQCRILYFMRKMAIHGNYPDFVHPWEYPMFNEFPLASKEEFLARPNDVCGIANVSYPRAMSFLGLQRDRRIKADCEILPHYRRIEYKDWVERHRMAKFFVEADASLGSERPMHLMTVSAMLRITSDHRIQHPRTDMVHQVSIGDIDGYIRPEDIDKLLSVLNNPDLCYNIYIQGAEHMKQHYSREACAVYVVDLIEKFLA